MDTALFKQYAALETKLKELESRKSELKEKILASLEADKLTKAESVFGTFTRATRTSYTYSDKVKALEEKANLAKLQEQQKGIAKAKYTQYLVVTLPKD